MKLTDETMPTICHSLYINVPPEDVYRCLTTPQGWDAWFTSGTEVDAREGGSIRLRWKNFGVSGIDMEDGGPVLEAVPGERFVFQWKPGSQPTTVTFELTPRGNGTHLSLTESGYPATERDLKEVVGCASGWGEALTLLKFYLEHQVTYGLVPEA